MEVEVYDYNLVSYPKGALPVKINSQTRVSVVLALWISVMLPPFTYGFPKQITDKYFFQNYRNSYWLRR